MNHSVAKMQMEIRRLNEVIRRHENNEAQTAFLEQLNAAALSGYCSQPFAVEDPIRASKLAMEAAEHTIETIIKSVAKARADEEKAVNDQIERMRKQSEINKAEIVAADAIVAEE